MRKALERSILCSLGAVLVGCGSTEPDVEVGALLLDVLDTRTELPAKVSVTFQVTGADGTPVPGLQLADFELLDNGQSDSEFESDKGFEPKPGRFLTSIALLLDLSGSITQTAALDVLKAAASAFVDSALGADGVELGVWWFDGSQAIFTLVNFTDDAVALKAAIDGVSSSITTDNSTNLNGAIIQGIDVMDVRFRSFALAEVIQAGALVVFTDGTDQASRTTASQAITAVGSAPPTLSVYSIGLSGEVDEAFLRTIGRSGSVFASDLDSLLGEFTRIAEEIEAEANSFYVLAYCSPRRSGTSNELTIRVRSGGREGAATTSYSAAGFGGGCQV